jgi:hypothetical protein
MSTREEIKKIKEQLELIELKKKLQSVQTPEDFKEQNEHEQEVIDVEAEPETEQEPTPMEANLLSEVLSLKSQILELKNKNQELLGQDVMKENTELKEKLVKAEAEIKSLKIQNFRISNELSMYNGDNDEEELYR